MNFTRIGDRFINPVNVTHFVFTPFEAAPPNPAAASQPFPYNQQNPDQKAQLEIFLIGVSSIKFFGKEAESAFETIKQLNW